MFYRMVESRLELVGVEDLNGFLLPPCTYRFAFSKVNLHMHHTVRERL